MTVDDLVASGLVERVAVDAEGAEQALEEARLHTGSAEAIKGNDRNGAYQLAYDGARKAVMAHMRRAGVRVRRGEGAHALTAQYVGVAISDELGRSFESMRKRRNRSEYGSAFFGADEVDAAIATAHALIESIGG